MTKDDKLRNVVKTVTISTALAVISTIAPEIAKADGADCSGNCGGSSKGSDSGCACGNFCAGACSDGCGRWVLLLRL